jgi:hypothetical protein
MERISLRMQRNLAVMVAVLAGCGILVSMSSAKHYANGALPIWTYPETINGNIQGYYGMMLDTFANHIEVNASAPVSFTVYAETTEVEQFNGTSINFWFNESEGCAGYSYKIFPVKDSVGAITIRPNITAVYDPSPTLTGICKVNNT